jgi:ppGpp synthetase/RelA/SpoT-type nucleotidyltranferase
MHSDFKDFLKKYNINFDDVDESIINWNSLCEIKDDYNKIMSDYRTAAQHISLLAQEKISNVHSIKTRVKDPEHLIAKIVRKMIKNPNIIINIENYREIITDIAGIRILHMYKKDWLRIHEYIIKSYELKEEPFAYVREGDSTKEYQENKIEHKQHDFGYRSIHYLLITKPGKENIVIEIQVRTIFEEGWAEIDHMFRYPYNLNNPIINSFLDIFNVTAGVTDSMATFLSELNERLKDKDEEIKKYIEEISQLKQQVARSNISVVEKANIYSVVDSLAASKLSNTLQYYSSITEEQVKNISSIDWSKVLYSLTGKK